MKCSYCETVGHTIRACNVGENLLISNVSDYRGLTVKELKWLVASRKGKISGKTKNELLEMLGIQNVDRIQDRIVEIPVGVTTVSNVKVKYLRPKYANLKEWMDDEANVYIGRAGIVFINGNRFPKKASIWANPFKTGVNGTHEEVVEKFERHIRDKIREDPVTYNLEDLRGRNLGCWCVDATCHDVNASIVCHGQILLRLLNNI